MDGDTIRIVIDEVGEMSVPVRQGVGGRTAVFENAYTPDIIKQN